MSLGPLGRKLRAAGHQVSSFDYFVAVETLDAIARRFTQFVLTEADGQPFAIVGHSLGNVITRMCLPLAGLERLVMLGPPNHPPVMARALRRNPVFRMLTRDAGRKLLDDTFYASLPVPTVPTLIIAGNRGPRAAWLPFDGTASDGVVRVEETRLDGVPHVEVPEWHTFIMNGPEVAQLVLRFVEHGALPEPLLGDVRHPGTPDTLR